MPAYNFSIFPVLVTERLILRQLTAADTAFITALRNNETVNQYLDRPKATTPAEAAQFIEKINQGIDGNKWTYWAMALKETNELTGTICLWNFDTDKNTAETGYELHPDFQGKGLMTEALTAVLDFGFNQLQLAAITAFTVPGNTASIKLLEKHHFKFTGTSAENPAEIIYLLNNPAYPF